MIVYDKLSRYSSDPKLLSKMKNVLTKIMKYLDSKNLLSEEGKEILKSGIDNSFSFHSELLTKEGNKIVRKNYKRWVSNILDKKKHPFLESVNTEDIKQFIDTPKVSFIIKKLGQQQSQPLMEVEVTKGKLDRNDYIKISKNLLKIENILLYGESVDSLVHGEEGILVLNGVIPIQNEGNVTVGSISILSEAEAKKHYPIGKLLLDKDIEQFEKVGFAAIKALQPRDYYPVLKSYVSYKYKILKKKCEDPDSKECKQKIYKVLLNLVSKQEKYCSKVQHVKDCKLAVKRLKKLIEDLIM